MKLRPLLALLLGLVALAMVLACFDLNVVMASLSRVGVGGFHLIVAAGLAAEIVLASGIIPLLMDAVPSGPLLRHGNCATAPPKCFLSPSWADSLLPPAP